LQKRRSDIALFLNQTISMGLFIYLKYNGFSERPSLCSLQKLRSVIAPFFLRREKKDVIKTSNPDAGVNPAPLVPDPKAHGTGQRQMDMSAQKNDLIVWLKPTPEQKRLYVSFLQSEQVKKVFNEKRSALAALTVRTRVLSGLVGFCCYAVLPTHRACCRSTSHRPFVSLGAATSSGQQVDTGFVF
jgi:hypothetical protein